MKKVFLVSLAISLLLVVVYFFYNYIINSCSGYFIYGLDDPYIHLSLAKNFVENGNIGINPNEFGFASSSPLWTAILIIIFKIFGYNELVPFYLNVIISIIIIIFSFKIVTNYVDNLFLSFALLFLIIIGIPIIPMIFIGMEHLLHLLLSAIFIRFTFELKNKREVTLINYTKLALITTLLSSIRYESIFLIFSILFIMFSSKMRLRYILFISFFAIIPHIIIGVYSINHGGLFFPNPIILKSYQETLSTVDFIRIYIYSGVVNLVENSQLFIAVLISVGFLIFFYLKNKKNNAEFDSEITTAKSNQHSSLFASNDYVINLFLIFLITLILHIQFAKTGWFYRYEAYLIGIFLIFILPFLINYFYEYLKKSEILKTTKGKKYLIIFTFLLFLPFIHRGIESLNKLKYAPVNIYEQQYLISEFLNSHFSNQPVGMNDIGLSSLKSNAKVIDIYGLADNNITKVKLKGNYTSDFFYDYLNKKNCTILIIFETWFEREINSNNELIRVATWKIKNNEVCGMDEVSFYALDIISAEKLKNSLKDYQEKLPKTINLRILI